MLALSNSSSPVVFGMHSPSFVTSCSVISTSLSLVVADDSLVAGVMDIVGNSRVALNQIFEVEAEL